MQQKLLLLVVAVIATHVAAAGLFPPSAQP